MLRVKKIQKHKKVVKIVTNLDFLASFKLNLELLVRKWINIGILFGRKAESVFIWWRHCISILGNVYKHVRQ